ncbi:spermidine/putrescine ABC transporter substrate-binding protein, partial [Streptomyces collinus]
MEQYEPDRLTPPQLAAMRRSLRNGRAAMTRRSLLRASAGGALTVGGLG